MKKVPQTPTLTCSECFLGNCDAWSWSQYGLILNCLPNYVTLASSLCQAEWPDALLSTKWGIPAPCPFCGNKKLLLPVASFLQPSLPKGPIPSHEQTWGQARPSHVKSQPRAPRRCRAPKATGKAGQSHMTSLHSGHLLLHSLHAELEATSLPTLKLKKF